MGGDRILTKHLLCGYGGEGYKFWNLTMLRRTLYLSGSHGWGAVMTTLEGDITEKEDIIAWKKENFLKKLPPDFLQIVEIWLKPIKYNLSIP